MLNLVICDDERTLRNDLRKVLETELELCGQHLRLHNLTAGNHLSVCLMTLCLILYFWI